MFNIQTINCKQYSEPVVIEISTYTEHFETQRFPSIEMKLFGP